MATRSCARGTMVTARFTERYRLRGEVHGAGRLERDGQPWPGDEVWLAAQDTAAVRAVAAADWAFASWRGGCGADSSCTLSNLTDDVTLLAAFEPMANIAVIGPGTVFIADAGVCTGLCRLRIPSEGFLLEPRAAPDAWFKSVSPACDTPCRVEPATGPTRLTFEFEPTITVRVQGDGLGRAVLDSATEAWSCDAGVCRRGAAPGSVSVFRAEADPFTHPGRWTGACAPGLGVGVCVVDGGGTITLDFVHKVASLRSTAGGGSELLDCGGRPFHVMWGSAPDAGIAVENLNDRTVTRYAPSAPYAAVACNAERLVFSFNHTTPGQPVLGRFPPAPPPGTAGLLAWTALSDGGVVDETVVGGVSTDRLSGLAIDETGRAIVSLSPFNPTPGVAAGLTGLVLTATGVVHHTIALAQAGGGALVAAGPNGEFAFLGDYTGTSPGFCGQPPSTTSQRAPFAVLFDREGRCLASEYGTSTVAALTRAITPTITDAGVGFLVKTNGPMTFAGVSYSGTREAEFVGLLRSGGVVLEQIEPLGACPAPGFQSGPGFLFSHAGEGRLVIAGVSLCPAVSVGGNVITFPISPATVLFTASPIASHAPGFQLATRHNTEFMRTTFWRPPRGFALIGANATEGVSFGPDKMIRSTTPTLVELRVAP
ncbi:MAG: hypothetical protein SFW67_18515 [Myxococcaceae bacterium]|nr:hypothetical protein [Myxococcaceae bacterium]